MGKRVANVAALLDAAQADLHEGRWLTPLKVQAVSDSEWMLTAPLVYWPAGAVAAIQVAAGTVTDFASVPRLPLVFALFGDRAHAAAALHDDLYTGAKLSRARCDELLRESAIAAGLSRWRAWCIWAGVRFGGASHYGQQT